MRRRRLPLGLDVTRGTPLDLRTAQPARRAARRPLRLRIRGPHRHCCIEWEALEVLVRLAHRSGLEVELECLTADGASVVISLV
jgi:hypothetical protein